VNKSEWAEERFREGFNCAQAVFGAFAAAGGIDPENAMKIASGFGGGIARRGETCGAVSGAVMALGLRYGKTRADDDTAKEKCYQSVGEFLEAFAARHGSTLCREILGVDISKPEGLREARKRELFTSVCPRLVGDSVEILEGLL
jgi:C_GCAxxG_C_C family probable redox protein